MVSRKITPVLATGLGWLLLYDIYVKGTGHSSRLWAGLLLWTGLAVYLAWKGRSVSPWMSSLIGIMPLVVPFGLLRLAIIATPARHMSEIARTGGLFALSTYVIIVVLVTAYGLLHLRSHGRFWPTIALLIGLIGTGTLLRLEGLHLSFRLRGMPPPSTQIMGIVHLPRILVVHLLITAGIFTSIFLVHQLMRKPTYVTLGAIGSVGFVLWSFWLEFDYTLVGSGYAYLMPLWFAFWLVVLLPLMSLTSVGRRSPAIVLVAHLTIAFVGVAVLAALVRVDPLRLNGVLDLLGIPVQARSFQAPGVGSLSGPLWDVFLRYLLQYGSMTFTGLAAYVLVTALDGGDTVIQAKPSGSHTLAGSLKRLRSLLGAGTLVLFLLAGCAPATPIKAVTQTAPPTPTLASVPRATPSPTLESRSISPVPTPSPQPHLSRSPKSLPPPPIIRFSPSPSPSLPPPLSSLPPEMITTILTPVPTPPRIPSRSPTQLQIFYLRVITHLVNRFDGDVDAVQSAFSEIVLQARKLPSSTPIPPIDGILNDLDGDGGRELLLFVPVVGEQCGVLSTCPYIGVLFERENDTWVPRVILEGMAGYPLSLAHIQSVSDLNGNGKADVLFLSKLLGAHTTYVQIWVGQWDGTTWQYLITRPVSVAYAQVQTRDWDEDGLADILARGGIITSVGAGLQRKHTFVLAWRYGAYQVIADIPDASDHPYFLMLDANRALQYHKWGDAAIFAATAWDKLLSLWDVNDDVPGERDEWIPPQPHRSRLFTYIGIERMLAFMGLGRGEEAKSVLSVLEATVERTSNPYLNAARRLWETYERQRDVVSACRVMEESVVRYPQTEVAFYPRYGYNMERLGLKSICPLDGDTTPPSASFLLSGVRGPMKDSP